ncbi:Fic/DOC family protein [Rubritalea squalenifaciens DSM 18772]|uniref:Fic/DOC family protein n=1 Tax=Rubritalea squalenifaciens DSM 18772 TaxID=1123071 RepID=A0A1M6GV14_9BACT|nr:Fic family protein [Rubritalea squalenifaciens]SHJ13734.1 Fic/DOC family protein [Rubritalea squalenifaciens DSM 18772]
MKTSDLTDKLAELQTLEMSPADEKRLWKKFQLEWNYHSNHIEGNTLTYGETELLFNHDKVTGTHSLRDIEEMKAHDVAIGQLRTLATDERPITESDIRQLNATLLKEPFYKDAMTADGKPTKKRIDPGEYKTTPNNVIQKDGSIFEFAPPAEVPEKIHELITWIREELENPQFHPIEAAALAHHRFVLIHPFDDGNGRTARLLMNYILLRSGYPPVIVKTETKPEYLAALQLADAGEPARLIEFLAKELDWSLDVSIKAAKGASIADEDDLDKEIAIFVKNQTDTAKDVVPRSKEAIETLAETSLIPFLNLLTDKLEKFSPIFVSTMITSNPPTPGENGDLEKAMRYWISQGAKNNFTVIMRMNGFKGEAPTPFDLQHQLIFNFTQFEYSIHHQNSVMDTRLYSEPLLQEEIRDMASKIQASIFEEIKKRSGQASR